MGNPQRVIFSAEAVREPQLADPKESKGKLKVRVPRFNGPQVIKITAANEDNVFVTKEVTVNVRGGEELGHPPGWRGDE